MSAAKLFWDGNYEGFRSAIAEKAHPILQLPSDAAFMQSMVKGRFKEGIGFKQSVINKFLNVITVAGIGMSADEIIEVSEEVVLRANASIDSLKDKLKEFRGVLGGDLTSMKSASDRINSEVVKMKQAYIAAQSILTSPEFDKAVQNAERLVVALEKIQALGETKLSVAVFGANPRSTTT